MHCNNNRAQRPQWVAVEGGCESLLVPAECHVLNLSRIRSPHTTAVGFVNALGVGTTEPESLSYKLPLTTKDGDLLAVFDPRCGDKQDTCAIAIESGACEKRLIVLKSQDRKPPASCTPSFAPNKEHLSARDINTSALGEIKLPGGMSIQAEASLGLVRSKSKDLPVSEMVVHSVTNYNITFSQRVKTSSKSPRHRRYELYKAIKDS
eukprot:Gregarina_sp_Poly_1__2069@NODE_1546_length_3868_cov_114_096290_g436_i2_p2_GENE_NODE_1546_length_3868_cov_114_096290_g436_i2NODE_1546_length_3868_cov_114_096290_g436_i2_p2_ORF_typecomplete_len207_score16_58_NODE_1546_length_3868_cov_114_096290_g436_i231623782